MQRNEAQSLSHTLYKNYFEMDCYKLNCVPPKDVKILAPRTCDCDLWK